MLFFSKDWLNNHGFTSRIQVVRLMINDALIRLEGRRRGRYIKYSFLERIKFEAAKEVKVVEKTNVIERDFKPKKKPTPPTDEPPDGGQPGTPIVRAA